jgi:hypothetical protein
MSLFKTARIVFLLSLLFVLVASTWMTEKRMAEWKRPILVTIYPIAADDAPSTLRFARRINEDSFREVNPVSLKRPPEAPHRFDPAAIGWWSLRMRWWAWMRDFGDDLIQPDIQMFLMLHGTNGSSEMGISVGMRKGRYGIVKAFARESMQPHNLVVFTHELLHVLGASDKYVISTGSPVFPHGFAEPNLRPLFPQERAEIMGGVIPINAIDWVMPQDLGQCKIGRMTAEEIGFFDKLKEL